MSLTVSMYRVIWTRRKGEDGAGQLVVEAQDARDRFHHGLLLDMHKVRILFAALESGTHVVERVFNVCEPWIAAFVHWRHRLGWSSRLRRGRFLVVVFSVDKGVTRSSPLDLAQSH